MRAISSRDRLIQFAIAAALVLPLAIAFFGRGGFQDALNQQMSPDAIEARRMALAAAAGKSFLLGILSVVFALAVGVPAGWALAQHSDKSSRRLLWLVIAVLPLALPASVAVSGWVGLFAPSGVASRFRTPLQDIISDRGWLFTLPGAAVVLSSILWPVIALELWPGFVRARNEAYDAALLSSTRSRAFFRIILPQVKGELCCGALLVFLLALTDFSVSSLLLVRTLPTEIHDALMLEKPASAAWASLPLIALVLAVAIVLSRIQSKVSYYGRASGSEGSSAGTTKLPHGMLALGVGLGFLLPMGVCLLQALNSQKPMSAVFGAGTDAMVVTLRVAGAAAALSIIVAIIRLIIWPEKRAPIVNSAALLLLAVPGSFLAAALLEEQIRATALARNLQVNALVSVIPVVVLSFGYLVRFLYVPLRLVEEGVATLDGELLDAAALAGHGRVSRAVSIALPLVAPHIAAGAALVFILALGEVAMASKLAPPGMMPATVWLFNQQHMGYDEAVFGLSLLLGVLAAGALILAGFVAALLLKLHDRARGSAVNS
jgi:iron(III) transport system permease protein